MPALRDLILIRKLRGVVLPPEEVLINTYSPLRAALQSSLNPFRPDSFQAITYVLGHQQHDHRQPRGVVQTWENHRRGTALVVYLAPDRGWEDPAIWPRWLENLCQKVGERGMRRVVACLPAEDTRLSAFQHVAFHIYAQEDIFRLANPPSELRPERSNGFRPRHTRDTWALARLYGAITPPLVQQAEGLSLAGRDEAICMPISSRGTKGYVLEIGQEILGYAETRRGSQGAWIRFLLHPQARDMAEALVCGTLNRLSCQSIYCSLPDYQGGVRSALQNVGFKPCGRQVVLVRHIAVFARRPIIELAPALEKGAEAIVPVARANKGCPASSTYNVSFTT